MTLLIMAFAVLSAAPAFAQQFEISLTPASDTNFIGRNHTVTATVTLEGAPQAGADVHFEVTSGGAPSPDSGDATTGANGEAAFTFTNSQDGTDTIAACVEIIQNNECGPGEPTDAATKTWSDVPPAPTAIDLAPATDTNPVGSDHAVTATVTDQYNDPFPSVAVHFDVTGAGSPMPSTGDATTNANGEATFTFSNDLAGTNTITACVDLDTGGDCDVGEPSDTATKTWTRSPSDISLTPSTDTNPVGSDHTVTATVTDEAGLPFQGVSVHFDVTGTGSPTPSSGGATTSAGGEAVFTFSNNLAGANTITACADVDGGNDCDGGEPSDTATKTWTRSPSDISLTPSTDTNPVGSNHTVTATVTDEAGLPFQGVTVHFTVSGNPTPGPASGNATTNASGQASFIYSNDVAGTNTITACVDLDSGGDCDVGEPSDTATKTWTRSPTDISLTPSTDINPVGSDHAVTATVTDEAGLPFQAASVHFVVSGNPTPGPASGNATTNESGQASFTFSNNLAGTNIITACADLDTGGGCDVGEPSDTATKTWTRSPSDISLTPSTDTNPVGSDHTVTATVTDEAGLPFQAASVHFVVSGNPTPGPASGNATSQANGQASFTYSNDLAGTNTITACVDVDTGADCDPGEPSDTATKTWETRVPEGIILTPPTDTNLVGTDHMVTATVTDQFADPFQGVTVRFVVTPQGAPFPATGSSATNAQGQATFTFSNTEAVTNMITACVDLDSQGDCDAGEPSDTATKTWQEAVLTIALSPTTDINAVGTLHTVTATVKDQFNSPFFGADLHFAVTGNPTPGPASGEATTNSSGQAAFTYSNNQAGTNIITVCIDQDGGDDCDDSELSATATKTWQAPPSPPSPPSCPGFEGDPRNQVVGTPGDDELAGTPGDDVICGFAGNDAISGLGGNDLILGGAGNDNLKGGAGDDNIRGAGGNDRINGGAGRDACRGGGGVDVVRRCER